MLHFARRDKITDFLTKKEAAELLRVTPRTMDRLDKLNQGPPRIKLGRRVRYLRSDIRTWITKRPFAGRTNITLDENKKSQ